MVEMAAVRATAEGTAGMAVAAATAAIPVEGTATAEGTGETAVAATAAATAGTAAGTAGI